MINHNPFFHMKEIRLVKTVNRKRHEEILQQHVSIVWLHGEPILKEKFNFMPGQITEEARNS